MLPLCLNAGGYSRVLPLCVNFAVLCGHYCVFSADSRWYPPMVLVVCCSNALLDKPMQQVSSTNLPAT